MRRLTTTLLLLALLLSLAAAVLAWEGDDDDECPAVCPKCPSATAIATATATAVANLGDQLCGDCNPTLSCEPCASPCAAPPLPPPAESDCDVLRRLCGKRYREHTVVDPAGVTWRKCHAPRCRASVAVP